MQPFHSLADFAEQHPFLDDPAKRRFFRDLHACFSRYAFQDISIPLPDNDTHKLSCHLLTLFSAIKPGLLTNRGYHFTHFLAVISKVASCSLNKLGLWGSYQIWVVDPDNPETPLYWGWMAQHIAETSETLMQQLTPEGIFFFKELSPLVLWTLQRFQEAAAPQTKIPKACLQATNEFLDQWNMVQVKENLNHWAAKEVMALESNEEPLFDDENPFGFYKRTLARSAAYPSDCLTRCMQAFSDFIGLKAYEKETVELPIGYRRQFIKKDLRAQLALSPPSIESEKRLVAAIQQVTRLQFTSLFIFKLQVDVRERQTRFFCPRELTWAENDAIPLEELELPVSVAETLSDDIPFNASVLVKLLLKAEELNIPSLKKHVEKLFVQSRKRIATEICNYYDNPVVSELLVRKRIVLTPDEKHSTPEIMRTFFLHNLKISPPFTTISGLIKSTFKQKQIPTSFLRSIWDDVVPDRRPELLNTYVNALHAALKPELDLFALQNFCGHLALGNSCFMPSQAIALFNFIKSPEVAEAFIHPELLESMIQAFPRIYSEIMGKAELEEWRKDIAPRYKKFLADFDSFTKKNLGFITLSLQKHLNISFYVLQTAEEMEERFSEIFFEEFNFSFQLETIQIVSAFFEKNNELFSQDCPKPLQRAYNFVRRQLARFITFASHRDVYEDLLKTCPNEDPNALHNLMNIYWKAECLSSEKVYEKHTTCWEKPMPLSLLVDWLLTLDQMREKLHIDLKVAVHLLTLQPHSGEQKEKPEGILTLMQLFKLGSAQKGLQIFKSIRVLDKDDELMAALNADLPEEQDRLAFTTFLNSPEVTTLLASHADLIQFAERVKKALEPAPLSLSSLFLSQLPAWPFGSS